MLIVGECLDQAKTFSYSGEIHKNTWSLTEALNEEHLPVDWTLTGWVAGRYARGLQVMSNTDLSTKDDQTDAEDCSYC